MKPERTADRLEAADRALFDRIARDYVRKDLKASCRVAREHRLVQTLRPLGGRGGDVLEIGCGGGFSARYLDGAYRSYTGVDYSSELIRYAREHNGGADRQFVCANVADYAPGRRFDVVLMIGVLHHMPDPTATLARLRTLLSPGGAVVVNEPQRGNPAVSALRWVRKRVDPSYSSDQVEFSEGDLRQVFDRAGYSVRMIGQGVASTPFAETQPLPEPLSLAFARLATRLDAGLEDHLSETAARRLAWNLIAVARPSEP
jgi:SAM-dependent methyltransferase